MKKRILSPKLSNTQKLAAMDIMESMWDKIPDRIKTQMVRACKYNLSVKPEVIDFIIDNDPFLVYEEFVVSSEDL